MKKGWINPSQKKGHVWLRNRLIEHINGWHMLDATVTSGYRFFGNLTRPKDRGLNRLVIGVGKGGRAILIYPIRQGHMWMPIAVARIMNLWEQRGAIVGCAINISDGFDICILDESSYKRKKRTYLHRRRLQVIEEKYAKKRRQKEEE